MKPKNSTTIPARDLCQTPGYALDPLLPYIQKYWKIWEPAAGKGRLVEALRSKGYRVEGTDINTGYDFLSDSYAPFNFDCIITNPPFSIKYKWLERCYELCRPFALLMPVDVLGAASAQRLFKKYGFEVMLLNKRVNYEMPNLGFTGHGAQFASAWFCWNLLPKQVVFGTITP